MINFTLIVVGSISAFAWRKLNSRKKQEVLANNRTLKQGSASTSISRNNTEEYDDVKEIKHSYRSSLYAAALVSAGSLFYRPIILLGLPVLGYGLTGFLNALKHSPKREVRSPLVIFEILSVSATLLTQHFFYLSALLTISLLRREFLLKTGNLVNYYSAYNSTAPKNIWVIREEVEFEVSVKDLQEDDVVVGRAGEMIMIEGKVIKGNASVRQFSLQRKMKNIAKGTGDKVYPFTVIDNGTIHISMS